MTSDGLLDEETEKQTMYQETQTQLRSRETNLYIQTKTVADEKKESERERGVFGNIHVGSPILYDPLDVIDP